MPPILTVEELTNRLSSRDRAIELATEAIAAGQTLSRYMEIIQPSEDSDRLDAFQRQLKAVGLITNPVPAAGIRASYVEDFFKTPGGRLMYMEHMAREWRKVAHATPKQRAIILSSDAVLGTPQRPFVDLGPFWNNQFEPAIPLSEIVARTSTISGEDFRSLYMTYDEEALRLFRVGESAEIPTANLETSTRSIRLRKYGRGLRTTYEQIRRVTVDRIAWWFRWQAVQSEVDKLSAALTYMINGDGNSGTAATEINQSTLDAAATPGELSLVAWLKFRMQFAPPYVMTTVLAQIDETLQMLTLNIGNANIPMASFNLSGLNNSFTPINATSEGIRYGWTDEAPDGKFLGFDRRAALEMVNEIGADITETERVITNQTEVTVMTEVNGFAILDPAATKLLDIAQ